MPPDSIAISVPEPIAIPANSVLRMRERRWYRPQRNTPERFLTSFALSAEGLATIIQFDLSRKSFSRPQLLAWPVVMSVRRQPYRLSMPDRRSSMASPFCRLTALRLTVPPYPAEGLRQLPYRFRPVAQSPWRPRGYPRLAWPVVILGPLIRQWLP